jgi:hypothetical protein
VKDTRGDLGYAYEGRCSFTIGLGVRGSSCSAWLFVPPSEQTNSMLQEDDHRLIVTVSKDCALLNKLMSAGLFITDEGNNPCLIEGPI